MQKIDELHSDVSGQDLNFRPETYWGIPESKLANIKATGDGKGNHINGLEGFWGYLKRRLAAKGGIRKERLPLYLAEYVWRYNLRNDSIQIQKKLIMKQLERLLI